MDALYEKEWMERIPVLKMEIDYELMSLYEALEEHDEEKINKTKEKLETLRQELDIIQYQE